MSTQPRILRYWPKMKVRGAHRRQRAPWDRLARSFDLLGFAANDTARHIKRFGLALENK